MLHTQTTPFQMYFFIEIMSHFEEVLYTCRPVGRSVSR